MSLAVALRKKDAKRELGDECYPIAYVNGATHLTKYGIVE